MPEVQRETEERGETHAEGVKTIPEKDLLIWTAPSRPFKRRTKDFYITVLAMAGLIGLIMFFIDGFMPVLTIVAVIFLYYVLSTVEPEDIEYKITNKGIHVAKNRTPWEILGRFWFAKRFSSELLIIETYQFPGRMELVILPEMKEKITKTLGSYLVHEEIPPSFLDKAATWVSKRLPAS